MKDENLDPVILEEVRQTTGRRMTNDSFNHDIYLICKHTKVDAYTALCNYYEHEEQVFTCILSILQKKQDTKK